MTGFKKVLNILWVVIVGVFAYLLFTNYFAKHIEDIAIKGIVLRKFVDTANHYSQVVVVKELTGEKEVGIDGYDNGLWEYLLQGDSVMKPIRSNLFIIKRDTMVKEFRVIEDFYH